MSQERSPRIIVFIDESGTPVETEKLFSCGAVWASPCTWKGCQQPLRFTIDEMRKRIGQEKGRMPPEIKYHDHSDMAEDLIEVALASVESDRSIVRSGHPWAGSTIVFGTASSHPATVKALRPQQTDSELGRQLRLTCIASLLEPFAVYSGSKEIDAAVVFDSDVWKTPIEQSDPGLVRSISNERVSLSLFYETSVSVPGLQLADLVAGMNRAFRLHSHHPRGFEFIQKRLLKHIQFKDVQIGDY
jgi:hypothetical protein